MAKKVEEVEVIEAKHEVVQQDVFTDAIRKQIVVIGEVELRGNFEKLKLGAMVSEAVRVLKLDGAQTGRGHAGGGALGWWNEVCPKNEDGVTVIAYRTVMDWKSAAENLPNLMGVGVKNADKVLELMAKDPEKAIGKNAKLLSSAEKVANGMTLHQMLLWGGDEEKNKGGRPKAGDAPIPKLSKRDEAKAIWNVLLQQVTKTSVKDAIPILGEKETQVAYETMNDIAKLLKKHLEEF